jgi:hypothetical protein
MIIEEELMRRWQDSIDRIHCANFGQETPNFSISTPQERIVVSVKRRIFPASCKYPNARHWRGIHGRMLRTWQAVCHVWTGGCGV